MAAVLEFCRDDSQVFRVRLSRSETLVGRGERCDVTLTEEHISRLHFLVRREGDCHRLVDRSRNGILLNGQAIDEGPLTQGDVIALPPWEIRYSRSVAQAPATVARDLVSPAPVVSVSPSGRRLTVAAGELIVRDGAAEGEQYVIRKQLVSVGSDPGCDWVLTGDLAPVHFSVTLEGDRYRLRDEGSDEGTRLDGQPVQGEVDLPLGSRVVAGGTELELRTKTHEDVIRPMEGDRFGEMVGSSRVMRELFNCIRRVAPHDVPVLVLGESGTGKELAARALHDHGARPSGPFQAVNCGAISAELVESELFGHIKGAFTGATTDRAGAFREASGGTLFLDEIGDLAPAMQVRFLRVLETGKVRPVGSDRDVPVDVRIVAATHRDLAEEVRRGTFREDLFFRLFVGILLLPPLRERPEDIPLLCRHFLETQFPHRPLALQRDTMRLLQEHTWRGNVRALRNVLLRAALATDEDTIGPGHIRFEVTPSNQTDPMMGKRRQEISGSLERAERHAILNALAQAEGNRTNAAKILGIAKSTLFTKLNKHGIERG